MSKEIAIYQDNPGQYMICFNLLGLPDSGNVSMRHGSFHARNSKHQKWKTRVQAIVNGCLPKTPLKRARITLTRHAPRQLDYDGLVASFKPVVDGLKTTTMKVKKLKGVEVIWRGVIEDDNWKVTGAWVVNQVYAKTGSEHIGVKV